MAGTADQFSDNQIDQFKEAFTLFDRNKDGTIFEAQVVFVMRALGIHVSEAYLRASTRRLYLVFLDNCIWLTFLFQELMFEADSDESGTIDFPEFLSLMAKVCYRYSRYLMRGHLLTSLFISCRWLLTHALRRIFWKLLEFLIKIRMDS